MSIPRLHRKISKRAIRSLIQQALETLEPRVLLAGNSYTIGVYSFTGGADGAEPFGGLVADAQGDFFGTTEIGGTGGDGSIYELPAGSGTAVALYDFTGTPAGANPFAGLTIDSFGDLFGTTYAGGVFGDGTVFEIPAGSTTPTLLYSFSGPDGANPYASVIVDSAGDIFGTTVNGGAHSDGTVFEIPAGGTLVTLHSFAGGPSDGATLFSPLVMDSSGNLFGTTFAGGSSGDGTVFEISAAGAYAVLHSFTGTDGSKPTDPLVIDGVGDVFGTTSTGGTDGDGTIFKIPAGGTLTMAYSFTGGTDGSSPFAGLTLDSAGDLFGTTFHGGAHGNGTAFEIPADAIVPETLYAFTGGGDGASPYGPIISTASGDLFGTTNAGGADGHGVIFELLPTLTAQMTVTKQPSDIQAGGIMPPVVVHLDLANTNLNVGDDSSVTLSIVSGPAGGTIGGTATVQANAGVATFSNLHFTRAGTYTLAATDGTLDPFVLDDFIVNSGPPARLAYGVQPTGFIAGQTMAPLTVDIEDSLGNITTDNSMVTLKLASGPTGAVLTGTLTVQAVNGVATFSDLSLTTTGSYTVSASDGKLTIAKSTALVVTPDTASAQLVFARLPATTIVAKPFAPGLIVEVQDQFGNLITSTASPVTVSLTGDNATTATLTGTTTVNIVKGVAAFGNLAISQPGSYQLQVTGAGLAPVTTANPIPNVFVPTHLVFTQQPSSITAGGTISPIVVKIEDAFNRIDTTNNSMVTISLKGIGMLSGTLSVQAVNGVATFSDLSLTKAGLFSLAAASGTLTLGKSANFNVIPDVSTSQLIVTLSPASPSVVGKPLAPNLVVEVEDQYGNLISSDHSAATLSIVGGPTESILTGITTVNDIGGVFTFKNLSLPVVGAYSLQVTDASLSLHILSTPITQTITPGVTSISGLPATSTHTFGQTIALSTTLKSTTPIPFTGIATLTDSLSATLGTVTLTSAGLAKFSLNDLAPGAYLCTVNYPGDFNHTAATSSTFTLLVNQAATTTALTTSSSTLVFGQPITLTATVNSTTAPSVARTGDIEFFDGPTLLQTVALNGNSIATLTLTSATVGVHSYKAIYEGDTNFKTSTSPVAARTVNKDKTAITLTPSVASPIDNQTFNLNLHVSFIAPGTSNLTGILVTIKDNGKTLGTANLDSNGDATLPGLTFTAPGMHTLTSIYPGDADTLPATSSPLKLTIT